MRNSQLSVGRLLNVVAWLSAGTIFTASAAQGAIVVNLSQTGTDVVASGGGKITSTAAFASSSSIPATAAFNSTSPVLLMNVNGTTLQRYNVTAMTGPSSFGTGGSFSFASATGDYFGLQYNTASGLKRIFLPTGYTLGSTLSGTATITGQSFATLGLTPNSTYTWSWGADASADSFTINVGTAPEPASLGVLVSSAVCILRRRR